MDVCREFTFGGLSKPDERRVRCGGVVADFVLFGSFCGVLIGDDTVDGGDFGVFI